MLYMPPQAAGADNIMPEVEAITTLAADELCPLAASLLLRPAAPSFSDVSEILICLRCGRLGAASL